MKGGVNYEKFVTVYFRECLFLWISILLGINLGNVSIHDCLFYFRASPFFFFFL